MAPQLELVVRNSGRVYSLSAGQSLTAGRTPPCELQLDDPSVSPRHCTITCADGTLRVTDLESANGTFINERSIHEAIAGAGDLIRLGAAVLEVRDPAGVAPRPGGTMMVADGSTVKSGIQRRIVRLMGEHERLLLDTIQAITATIDARDGHTHRHPERVAALTAQLARELGLTEAERETAELSALLHDVGKIAVPDSILNKPGKLTPEEFEEMQKHPVNGARILGNIQSATVKAVLPGVQYHHEKWDGTGYPEGLKAEAIPFLGRLLCVADFFDAVTSARAYRAAMPAADAMKMIMDGAGRHFDPAVASALQRLFDRGDLNLEAPPSDIGVVAPDKTG